MVVYLFQGFFFKIYINIYIGCVRDTFICDNPLSPMNIGREGTVAYESTSGRMFKT